MPKLLVTYLSQRSDASTFLLPEDLARSVEEIFPRAETVLPEPYNIYPADETQAPNLGFPVLDSPVMRDLDARLDRWLTDEVVWQVRRLESAREKAQIAFTAYLTQLMKVAENALLSNLLNDYHAVFWLAHSLDLARQFSSIPRRVSALDSQIGRLQGDPLKYRLFGRWATETRDQLSQIAARASTILDGEEQRGLQFFRMLQEGVLILTDEFIGPDLRELRSFVTGHLRRDFQSFRDSLERLRETAVDLLTRDRSFRGVLPLFGVNPDQGIPLALLLNGRFQSFLFDLPSVQNVIGREDREQIQSIARRLREFGVLNHLRRGIVWMSTTPEGEVLAADQRSGETFSRSTRPLDFGRPGVVDPMVHRFGLIYDISNFSETLGNIRRAGRKEEISSYRHMLLFQRKLESVAQRHVLQFEKFLGDGAFYTTRRATRLVRAAVEIQRSYAEIRTKGFAFNKGLRIALNFGYYRLLPMKPSPDADDRITEFYGPGIVELSRLTTGKASKEIDEIASFLVARGYDPTKVQNFFAPIAHGVDVIDHAQHAREFYAYVNANNSLINEGIVASMAFVQELSNELTSEGQQLHRLRVSSGNYIGFAPAVSGVEFIGIRFLGTVSLKGLDNIEVGEVVPFAPGEAEAIPLDSAEPLVAILRQDFHQRGDVPVAVDTSTTTERVVDSELVVCVQPEVQDPNGEVLIGEWDPQSDNVSHPVRLPRDDFRRLFSLGGTFTPEELATRKDSVRDLYNRLLSDRTAGPSVSLGAYRSDSTYQAFVLGQVVEKKL
jgi:hypothetical protein